MTRPVPATSDMARGFFWMGIAFLALAVSITTATLLRSVTPPGEPSEVLVEWTGRQFGKPRRVEMAFTVTDPAGNAAALESGHHYRGEVGLGMWGRVPRPGERLQLYLPPDTIPQLVPVDGTTEARAGLGVLPWFWLMALLSFGVAAALRAGPKRPGPG